MDVTSEFTVLSADLKLSEVARRHDRPVVVAGGASYWVLTPEEWVELLEENSDEQSLRGALGDHMAVEIAVEGRWPQFPRAVMVRDDGQVTAVMLEGSTPTASPPPAAAPPPAAVPTPPTRGIDFDDLPTDLGAPRSADPPQTSSAGDEPEAAVEPWNIQTEFPRQVAAGSLNTLLVELTREAEDGPDVSVLPVELEEGTEVGVVVQAKAGFEIEGAAEGELTASDDGLPLRFQLRAAGEEGAGKIRVLFFVEATAIGAITLEPAILAADAELSDAPVATSEVVSALSVGRGRPDLELLVLEQTVDGQPAYSIRVTSQAMGFHLKEFGPITLRTDARQFYSELFMEIEGFNLSSRDDRRQAQRILEAKGASLFEVLIPEGLRQRLWQARDSITRIRIDSEEPHIPWELVRLSGPDENGDIVEGKFLCEYETTRWIPGPSLEDSLRLADIALVVPSDSGLASAQEEKEFLLGLADEDRSVTVIPSRLTDVMDAFAEGRFDVWHFSGHGAARDDQDPNRFAIQLEDGGRFTPEELSGSRKNLGKADPLVFLNACQVGRSGMSLTGLGGWANQFLDAGAACFVGAMWSVHDNPARDFARTFYTRLLEGDTIGEATLAARNHITQFEDATWLAYTVYGHPSAAMAIKE